MRSLLSTIAALGLLAAPLAQASQCARPADRMAFDVTGLKSQLMVTAISCQAQDRYNAFITRYRSDLVMHERSLNSYFQRSFGRAAQKQHDDYITLLANAQSERGIQLGTLFCQKSVGVFDEVMALKDGKELPSYASTKSFPQPVALIDCPAAPVKPTRTAKK